jgi:hypothetical protein
MTFADRVRALETDAPRLYSSWSRGTWRLACAGPALRLWEACEASPRGEGALWDYLVLLREAVGRQYLSATRPEDFEPSNPQGIARSFLATAFVDTLPRLLPDAPPETRAHSLAALWNVGEKLQSKPVWLNRYLSARLRELNRLDDLEPFLSRALSEGWDAPVRKAPGPQPKWSVVDGSLFDRDFVAGPAHLATPTIACVHDRRHDDRRIAILLRPQASGGPICLGLTPCFGDRDPGAPPELETRDAVLTDPGLPEPAQLFETKGGLLVLVPTSSQRIWIGGA